MDSIRKVESDKHSFRCFFWLFALEGKGIGRRKTNGKVQVFERLVDGKGSQNVDHFFVGYATLLFTVSHMKELLVAYLLPIAAFLARYCAAMLLPVL